MFEQLQILIILLALAYMGIHTAISLRMMIEISEILSYQKANEHRLV